MNDKVKFGKWKITETSVSKVYLFGYLFSMHSEA